MVLLVLVRGVYKSPKLENFGQEVCSLKVAQFSTLVNFGSKSNLIKMGDIQFACFWLFVEGHELELTGPANLFVICEITGIYLFIFVHLAISHSHSELKIDIVHIVELSYISYHIN